MIGRTLGGYRVHDRLGSGGMADVYLARTLAGPSRYVALKVLKPDLAADPEFRSMFDDEARLMKHLSHPGNVAVIDSGTAGGTRYIAMELLAGPSLKAVWEAETARGETLSGSMVAYLGARIADVLHFAHELTDDSGTPLEVVHRDVNQANVVLTEHGVVKVIDFGLARSKERNSKTATGVVKGKLGYLAPEQTEGIPLDRRVDVFALGTMLWELSTGRRLFRRDDDIETVQAVHACKVPDPRTLRKDYPAPLWDVLRKSLSRSRDDRYRTADEMRAALDACADFLGGAGAKDVAHLASRKAVR